MVFFLSLAAASQHYPHRPTPISVSVGVQLDPPPLVVENAAKMPAFCTVALENVIEVEVLV
jgi:hypothetical protein